MKPTFRAGNFEPDPEKDIHEEMEAHIEMEAESLMSKGMSREEAVEEARRLFGDRKRFAGAAVREANARERKVRWQDRLEAVVQDVRYALRRMLRSPGFTGIAILSLALGIGANTAIFSLVNAILLSGVPMRAPQELVEVYTSEEARGEEPGYPYSLSSVPDLLDLREHKEIFSGVGGYEAFFNRIETEDSVDPVWGEIVSWDLFSTLGITPAAGRFFVHEEGQSYGTHPVVVLGFEFWQKRFGGSQDIIGETIRMANREWTVVGVAPKELQGFTAPGIAMDMFSTYEMAPTLNFEGNTGSPERRTSHSTFIKARLAPGVTVEEAQAAMATLAARNREAYPEAWEGREYNIMASSEVAIHPIVDGPLKAVATLLLTVVALVLLVACTNLAGFLLARASDRKKEIAIRLAMGARRWTLVRQLLTETVILGLLGGIAGLVVAYWTLQALMRFQPPSPIPINLDVGLDRTVLLFALAVSAAAGLFFGLIPALQSTNPDVAPTLKDETGSGSGRPKRFSLRNGLIVTQVAISMVLLLGAGLFLRSLQSAGDIDLGFGLREAGILWIMSMGDDMTGEEFQVTYQTLVDRAQALPGITQVGSAEMLPIGISYQESGFDIAGVEPEAGEEHLSIAYNIVSPSYFDVMEISLVSGRGIMDTDRAGAEPVVVISETAARRYWPGENPIGQSIKPTSRDQSYRVVGVANDTKVWTLGEEYRPYIYFPFEQYGGESMMLVARGDLPEAQIVGQLRRLVAEVDSRLIVMEEKTMTEHLSVALFPPRMAALLLGVFGGLALILATTGLYGTVAYSVSRRSKEMGIRMSLGADAGSVVRMVLKGAMGLVAVGAFLGWALSLGLAQTIRSFLYGVTALDPVTFIGVPLVLGGVALAAAIIPARRASRVNPVTALKSE
ncbi:ADOP family duplicated permease [Gemmatimonadota bacterium]